MKKLRAGFLAFAFGLGLLAPGLILAAGGKAEHMVIVADSRNLTGILEWLANLYNESRLLFTILTVILVVAIGLLLEFLAKARHEPDSYWT